MAEIEILSEVLTSLRAHGSVYFCDRQDPPWSMKFDNPESASFHLVRRGECFLLSKNRVERLGPGDLLFVEAGRSHVLTSENPDKSGADIQSDILLMCGYFSLDANYNHPLMRILQGLIVIKGEELLLRPGLKNILDLLSSEFTSSRPGSQVIVNKLTEILLVELIRINFGRDRQNSFIAALFDKQISHVLELIHKSPEYPWTLETLASKSAMSRATLANRFKRLVGQPMFEYLTELRMRRARELLRTTNLPLYDIANKVGYASDLAFTKTFRKRSGMTPTAFRKNNSN